MSITSMRTRFAYPAARKAESPEDQAQREAALRQFPLHRVLSYGVEFGDATRLLELVQRGQMWCETAVALAADVLSRLDEPGFGLSEQARARLHHRASALLRISQAMTLANTPERVRSFASAVDHYAASKACDPRFERVLIESRRGPVAGWFISPASAGSTPVVAVQGGAEGWAMEWEEIGLHLVERGMAALMFDGPGQGETRILHEHYFDENWLDTFGDLVAFMLERAQGQPIGLIGNSMAGSKATLIAERYPFGAVINNGGPLSLADFISGSETWSRKVARQCRPGLSAAEVTSVFETIGLKRNRLEVTCPYLIIQGEADPMVSVADAEQILDSVTSADKQLVLFEEGEHTVSKFPADKLHVMVNWMHDRLHKR